MKILSSTLAYAEIKLKKFKEGLSMNTFKAYAKELNEYKTYVLGMVNLFIIIFWLNITCTSITAYCMPSVYQVFLTYEELLGSVAQSVTCLTTDPCLTADPGVASLIPAESRTLWRFIMK